MAPRAKDHRTAIIAAVVAGIFTLLGAVIGKVSVISFGGTTLDKPTVTLARRDTICFWHGNATAGYRLIARRSDGTWLETQPNGMVYHHAEIGRVTIGPFHGTMLQRKENPIGEPWPVEVFIPDVGAGNVLYYRPDQQTGWEYAALLEPSNLNCPRVADHRG